jgi:hypothetical protein
VPPKNPHRTVIERIAALECMGEVEGFLAQMARDGRTLTDEEQAAMARHKVKLQRGRAPR